MNKKFPALCFSLFLLVIIILFFKGNVKQRNYKFNGIIESITFDVKQISTIVISNEKYYLSPLKGFKENVQVGDSAIKKSGTLEFIIIKKTNGKVYNYKL